MTYRPMRFERAENIASMLMSVVPVRKRYHVFGSEGFSPKIIGPGYITAFLVGVIAAVEYRSDEEAAFFDQDPELVGPSIGIRLEIPAAIKNEIERYGLQMFLSIRVKEKFTIEEQWLPSRGLFDYLSQAAEYGLGFGTQYPTAAIESVAEYNAQSQRNMRGLDSRAVLLVPHLWSELERLAESVSMIRS